MIEWRQIPGHPEYEVSSTGLVRRAVTVRMHRAGQEKVPNLSNGYMSVHLYRDGKCRPLGVHVAVCMAFHGPKPTAKHQVAHWNGIRSDNRAENVRWVLPVENAADRARHGRTASGERAGAAKIKGPVAAEILRRGQSREFLRDIAADYGLNTNTVGKFLRKNGVCRRHKS